MRKIICDRCYEEITENPVKICMEEVDRKTGDFAEYHLHEDLADIDLCKKCADCLAEKIRIFSRKKKPVLINQDFEDAIQDMIATSQPDEDTPPPEDKPKRRLDGGKIQALRNAGWTVKAIAEEMSCSEQAIYNALKKPDKKKAPEPGQQEGQSKTN